MTLPVCAVQCYVYTQDGEPDPGAIVTAKLNRYEVYNGHIVPESMSATADENGLAVLELWPNELGSTGSAYEVKIAPTNGNRTVKVNAVVPLAAEASLADISVLPPYEGKPDGQAAVEYANAAAASALLATSKAAEASDSAEAAALDAAQNSIDIDAMRGESRTFRSFGAVGDGVADDSTAVASALAWMASKTCAMLDIGDGVFKMDTQAVQAITGNNQYVIKGNGASSVILGNNSVGAIKITSGSRQTPLCLMDCVFSPNIADSGTAFEYSVPEGGTSTRRNLLLHNVTVAQHLATNTSGSWKNPLILTGHNRPLLNNVVLWRSTTTSADCLINLDGCYNPEIKNSYINGSAAIGISNVKTISNEGFSVAGSIINGADTGLYISQPDRHPLIWVTNCHFNNKVTGVHLVNCKYAFINANLMYSLAASGESYTDFKIDNCNGINLNGNVYRNASAVTLARRHLEVINGSRNIRYRAGTLAANTSIAPYFIGLGCADIDLNIPEGVIAYDFASYPAKLYESLVAGTVDITSPGLLVRQVNSSAQNQALRLRKSNSSPGASDTLSALLFEASNTAQDDVTFGSIVNYSRSATAGAHSGGVYIYAAEAGALRKELTIADGVGANTLPRGYGTISAGGNNRLYYGVSNTMGIYGGLNTPEGVVTAVVGSIYMRSNGGAGTTFYVKESGTGNTGWVAK